MAKQLMGQEIDFNKLRKSRQRIQAVKRLAMLLGLVAMLGGLVILNNIMVEESVTTRISDLVQGLGGSGYPVPLPGGVIRDLKHTGDNLAVLNDTNLYVYNPKGKTVNSVQRMTDNTVLLAGDNRLLTYDVGSKSYSIHSSSKTLLEQKTEFGIITAGMNNRGDYAIVSSSKQHACEITVYNNKFKNIYNCLLTSDLVSSVSISPKGGAMAAGHINISTDGVLQSGVTLYRFSSDVAVAKVDLPDALVMDVNYLGEDRIGILTDRQYLIVDGLGSKLYNYDLDGRQVTLFRVQAGQTLLLFENREARNQEIVFLDEKCQEKATLTTGDRVLDMALSSKRIYLLTENSIDTCSQKLERQKSEPVQFATCIHLTDSKLYYLTRDEICVLGQTTVQEPEEKSLEEGTVSAGEESAEISSKEVR